jgi:hypothetical protein
LTSDAGDGGEDGRGRGKASGVGDAVAEDARASSELGAAGPVRLEDEPRLVVEEAVLAHGAGERRRAEGALDPDEPPEELGVPRAPEAELAGVRVAAAGEALVFDARPGDAEAERGGDRRVHVEGAGEGGVVDRALGLERAEAGGAGEAVRVAGVAAFEPAAHDAGGADAAVHIEPVEAHLGVGVERLVAEGDRRAGPVVGAAEEEDRRPRVAGHVEPRIARRLDPDAGLGAEGLALGEVGAGVGRWGQGEGREPVEGRAVGPRGRRPVGRDLEGARRRAEP